MYVKRNYGFWMTFIWSGKPFLLGGIYAAIVCVLFYYFELKEALPWQPVSVLGIAVAFYLGFKNNSSYDRTWEARKIWGGIVNNSRSFGAAVLSFVQGEDAKDIQKELIYRHIAWLTALRFQLRLTREWEHTENRVKGMFSPVVCEDYIMKMDESMNSFLSKEELREYQKYSNVATQIMKTQSVRLQELMDKGYFEDFRHMEFHHLVTEFYNDQGRSERIKNFPFPRQYASTALWLTCVFCALVPFALIGIFSALSPMLFWVCPLISALIIWVFFLMEKIGDYSENPFEGTYNDVPITSIARGIEIDLREMLDDDNIPEPLAHKNGFLL